MKEILNGVARSVATLVFAFVVSCVGAAPLGQSPVNCSDRSTNGQETDVDCGGPVCAKCDTGKACKEARDCVSGNCTNLVCAAPPSSGCGNGMKDGQETDADCGGGICGACGNGKVCQRPGDCQSGQCTNNMCVQAPTGGCSSDTQCTVVGQRCINGVCAVPPMQSNTRTFRISYVAPENVNVMEIRQEEDWTQSASDIPGGCIKNALTPFNTISCKRTFANGASVALNVRNEVMNGGRFFYACGLNGSLNGTLTVVDDVTGAVQTLGWIPNQSGGCNLYVRGTPCPPWLLQAGKSCPQ